MPETPLETQSSSPKHAPLQAELEEALIDLLAHALVAELVESANNLKTQEEANATVASPSGHVRTVGDSRAPAT